MARHVLCSTCFGERGRQDRGLNKLRDIRLETFDDDRDWDADPTHYCCVCGAHTWLDYTFESNRTPAANPRTSTSYDCSCADLIDPADFE